MGKTTEEHFVFFSVIVREWQEKLGLSDWDIQIRHSDKIGMDLATTNADCDGQVAMIALNKEWPDLDEPTKQRLKRVALHETIHVLLADLYWIAECRYTTQSELSTAEHKIVRRLEKALGD